MNALAPDPRRMVGDPFVSGVRAGGVTRDAHRNACLYGAAIMRKVGRLPDDMLAIDVHFEPPATLIFISADGRQVELERFVISDRVLTYDPRPQILPPSDAGDV